MNGWPHNKQSPLPHHLRNRRQQRRIPFYAITYDQDISADQVRAAPSLPVQKAMDCLRQPTFW